MTEHWTMTEEKLPPAGVVVDTIAPRGTAQQLKRSGRLWFFPDDSMYVYYTPTMWRQIEPSSVDKG